MSFLAHVVIVLVVGGGLLVLGIAAAYVVARRMVRRRWPAVRGHVATRGVLSGLALVAAWRERVVGRVSPEEMSRGPAARARRRMWVAVEDAEVAVQHADAVGAPVAELPAVCRSLRAVAGDLDQLLRLERRLPGGQGRPEAVRVQVAEVIRAARGMQLAALQACGDANEPQLRALVRDARDEVEIVASALSRLRSLSSN